MTEVLAAPAAPSSCVSKQVERRKRVARPGSHLICARKNMTMKGLNFEIRGYYSTSWEAAFQALGFLAVSSKLYI